MTSVGPDFVALCIVGAIVLAGYLGLLEKIGLKPRDTADAAGEIAILTRTNERLRHERNTAIETAHQLEAKTSLEPLLAELHAVAELNKQVLERLVHHNGAFAHMETAMNNVHESLKLLTGFIAGLVELPTKEEK